MGHATQKTGAAVLLPDGVNGTAEIFGDVKFWMEIIPTGEEGTRLKV